MNKLFTFRRCPYAMRARMALSYAGIEVPHIEVDLKNKPQELLDISPKATVPVLVINNKIIDESLDIMRYAMAQNDPEGWYALSEQQLVLTNNLINSNDTIFKKNLDNYKYPNRNPDKSKPAEYYLKNCNEFLCELDALLKLNKYLVKASLSFVDIAIFPFIRQFSKVDAARFSADFENTRVFAWLNELLDMELFSQVMQKKL